MPTLGKYLTGTKYVSDPSRVMCFSVGSCLNKRYVRYCSRPGAETRAIVMKLFLWYAHAYSVHRPVLSET